eukprot:TRINITY_DN90958_c0_g1_i2.p1 TRINITY_DN90958_c0_g1~~TRINITY_DN90958_c0_g1_i2.p1  ORF type:complete len:387 (+),score=62.22 TRINITY_DN90958_c0_g1_i2:88-1248(+)
MALVAPARLPVMHNNLVDEADSGMIVTTAVVVGSVKGALYKGHQNGSVGFRRSLEQDYQSVTKRFFILDNSGSTAKPDGHVLVNSGEKTTSLDSSRWEEIRSMAVEQAEWCLQTGVETEFIILNSPSPQDPQEGRDFFTVDPRCKHVHAQIQTLQRALKGIQPHGPTPLAATLAELRSRLARQVADGRLVMVSIVTDGLPTIFDGIHCYEDKKQFVSELRALAAGQLRVFIVIRLATDEDRVVDFYNQLDEELELPLDILDDIAGEAKEVYAAGNGWFAYSPLVHRIREAGSVDKLFDLLDERAFLPLEIMTFLESLLLSPSDPPFPREPKEFLEAVGKVVGSSGLVYDGRTGRMVPPVNMSRLRDRLAPSKWKKAVNCVKAYLKS